MNFASASMSLTFSFSTLKVKLIEADAKFILAIETGGMFDRLVENGFDEDAKCILVHLKGQPSRSTRRLLKRLNEELKLQVATFSVDGTERILIWENGVLKPVTVGPYLDRLMDTKGTVKRNLPIVHERTPVESLGLAVPAIAQDGSMVEQAPVSTIIRHEAPEEMYEIQSAYGFSVRVTGAHSV